jgi:hypothetical protein
MHSPAVEQVMVQNLPIEPVLVKTSREISRQQLVAVGWLAHSATLLGISELILQRSWFAKRNITNNRQLKAFESCYLGGMI